MAGAVVLISAGFLSTVVGNATDTDSLSAGQYQTISESYAGGGTPAEASGSVDVSRDFDRATFTKQLQTQKDQRDLALSDLAAKVDEQSAEIEAEIKKNQWVIPVTGYSLTARFGQASALWSNRHTGIDLAGPSGSTIVSVAAGTVTSAGYEGAYGNRTVVTLEDGTEIWYAHQSRLAVSVGDAVTPGQTIGYTGSTGNVTGPHLHLEVRPAGGGAVDPEPILLEHGVTP
ncbi:M23 family metallopeptidase [Aeromicrobium sp. CF3.5]|uniref:M23 family metallopeptidase n=1 Tax=Aeromicrobium sp. CF3.5 TaxID=3373078 RepID=UPI003EE735EE